MQIITDFIPKPGDEVIHKTPSGQTKKYIWMICPDCSKGRWVLKGNANTLLFTGCCKECYIKKVKSGLYF